MEDAEEDKGTNTLGPAGLQDKAGLIQATLRRQSGSVRLYCVICARLKRALSAGLEEYLRTEIQIYISVSYPHPSPTDVTNTVCFALKIRHTSRLGSRDRVANSAFCLTCRSVDHINPRRPGCQLPCTLTFYHGRLEEGGVDYWLLERRYRFRSVSFQFPAYDQVC